MRHDYKHPPDWESMDSDEKHRWMTQERCRRQAQRQTTATRDRLSRQERRLERRFRANGYEPLEDEK